MPLTPISPQNAERLARDGAKLIDIRNPDEVARLSIPQAENHPLGEVTHVACDGKPAIFFCRSGMRTQGNANVLARCVDGEAYMLEGGIEAWRKAGLEVEADAKAPLEIMRQVQITAGMLVLVGVILGLWVAPAWFALSAFVGAGLTFAGVSGWCGMASLLALMPWNRRAAA